MYSEKSKFYSNEYAKKHYKSILLNFDKDEFADVIKPAIDESGMPVNTYIKLALKEKMERDAKKKKKGKTVQNPEK